MTDLMDEVRKTLQLKADIGRQGGLTSVAVCPSMLQAILSAEETARAAQATSEAIATGMSAANQRLRVTNGHLLNQVARLEVQVTSLEKAIHAVADEGQVFSCREFILQRQIKQQAGQLHEKSEQIRTLADELIRITAMESMPRPNRLMSPVHDLDPVPLPEPSSMHT